MYKIYYITYELEHATQYIRSTQMINFLIEMKIIIVPYIFL